MPLNVKPLKICIDARLPNAALPGGVAKVLIGLATAFSKMADGHEEYHFYTFADADQWIRPYLRGPCRIFPGPRWGETSLRKRLANVKWLQQLWRQVSDPMRRLYFRLPRSDGTIEQAGFDLIHFTLQNAFLTEVPSIYQPHDLQHLHYPELFLPRDLFWRAKAYPTFCERAQMVVAMSQWGKQDLIRHFQLPEEKISVVPWGPWTDSPVPTATALRETRQKFQLPDAFLFLPAQTWAHKNHIAVLKALKILQQEHGLKIPFICSGHTNEFFAQIQKQIDSLQLSEQVKFIGFVTEMELECLYRLARALVFPTKFEGWGLPITEAFFADLPVACSNVTCLPALAGDAALIFNPNDPRDISAQILRLWTEEPLRQTLIEKGKKRAGLFSWDHTARIFRAHYRRLCHRPLTPNDHSLLSEPPLV